MNFFRSTKKNRDAQRASVTAQLASGMLSVANPVACIPLKVSQAAVSAFSVFSNIKPHEKILNAAQGILAASESIVAMALFTHGEDCEDTKETLCRVLAVLGLTYQGVLMAHLAMAELRKERGLDSPNNSPSSSNISILH